MFNAFVFEELFKSRSRGRGKRNPQPRNSL